MTTCDISPHIQVQIMKKYLFILLISFVTPSVFPDENGSHVYVLENEELQQILHSMMKVAVDLDNVDEIILNGNAGLNTLKRRETFIRKMNELKTRKNQIEKRVKDAENLLLPSEKSDLEKTIQIMDLLYEYNDVLEDPFIILSNIINLGTLCSMIEFEGLINLLIKNYYLYKSEYNNVVDSADQFSKDSNVKRLAHIVSRLIEDWLRLNMLNNDTIFKNNLSDLYKNKLEKANNLYRKFLERIHRMFIIPSIKMKDNGSFYHFRMLVAMIISSEKEEELLKLNVIYDSYKRNSIPIPENVEDFFEICNLKTTKILRDLQQYIRHE